MTGFKDSECFCYHQTGHIQKRSQSRKPSQAQFSGPKSTGSFRKKSSGIRHLEESQEDSQIQDKEDGWPIFHLNLPNSLVIVVSVETEGESLDMEVDMGAAARLITEEVY